MQPEWIAVLKGTAAGFVSAGVVDLMAWTKSGDDPCDWKLAAKRWVGGAVSGFSAGFAMMGWS